MKLTASIVIDAKDPSIVTSLLTSEELDRSSCQVSEKEGKIHVAITAKDPTAFKMQTNRLAKSLIIYEESIGL